MFSCAEHGIVLSEVFSPGVPHMAFGNFVSNTGLSSLVIEGGGLYRDNVLLRSGFFGAGSPTIVGGSATGGNFCDDGRCSRRGLRRYYLSQNTANGSQAQALASRAFIWPRAGS